MTLTLGVGIPRVHWCGTEGDYHVLVMELLGPSLESMFQLYNRKLSLKCSVLLAEQMVCAGLSSSSNASNTFIAGSSYTETSSPTTSCLELRKATKLSTSPTLG